MIRNYANSTAHLIQNMHSKHFLEVAELYFSESLTAYKEVLGMDHSQTMEALKEFCKWLAHTGKRKVIV